MRFWPPVEVCPRLDDFSIEAPTSIGDDLVELVDCVEVFICDGFVDKRP